MASLFTAGKFQAIGPTGIVPGGRLYTYAAGTLTPLATFTNQAGGSSNTNPVVCDANGQASVWLGGSAYRMILKNASDVVIWDVDNITAEGGFTASGVGSVTRSMQDKVRDFAVSVMDFGAVGDGVADDTAAFNAAFVSLGSLGGTVIYPHTGKFRLSGNVAIPAGCTLKGPSSHVGLPGLSGSGLFSSLSSIRLSSSSTISLGSGSTIEGALIYRDGMTFPATDASAFAGVAITAAGDDATVLHSMILGFATAFTSTGFNRQTLDSVLFDCTNGIIISNCQDVAKLHQCHGWPFSIAPGSPTVTTQRAGYAFQYKNVGDWNKITDCFSFGYFRGFNVSSADHCVLLGCGADSFVGYTGSVGILVDGTSADTALVACQAAAQERGIVVITTAPLGNHTTLTDCQTWGNTISGLQVHTGDATVTGGSYRTTDSGIVVSGTSSVWVDRVRFENIVTAPINCTVNTSTVYIGDHNDFTGWVGPVANNVNRPMATIDSATTITLPTNGNHFVVLGTTTIAGLLGGWAGRQLTLIFTGTLTVTHSTGLYLKGATNRSATAGHTMRLIHDSTNWYEV